MNLLSGQMTLDGKRNSYYKSNLRKPREFNDCEYEIFKEFSTLHARRVRRVHHQAYCKSSGAKI
jgi:hypothetical protein